MERQNAVLDKSFDFAVRMVNLYKFLNGDKQEFVMSRQVLRSGTAIGALVREAQQAESNADFVHKLSIALKEANETEYWLLLLTKTGYISQQQSTSIIADCHELLKLLTSIIKTSKQNNGQ